MEEREVKGETTSDKTQRIDGCSLTEVHFTRDRT
jgi:hypothetical protein